MSEIDYMKRAPVPVIPKGFRMSPRTVVLLEELSRLMARENGTRPNQCATLAALIEAEAERRNLEAPSA